MPIGFEWDGKELMRIGFQWECPWRIEWKTPREYWYRTQIGPFYLLHRRA